MSAEDGGGGGRVRIREELEEDVVDPLIKHGYFKHKYEVVAFAAALGFRAERAADPGKASNKAIRLEYFRENGFDLAINVIALEEGANPEADDSERLARIGEDHLDSRLRTFERYASGGLEILKRECFESEGVVLDGLLRLIEQYAVEKTGDAAEADDLREIAKSF